MRGSGKISAVVAVTAVVMIAAPTAQAAFPGQNGKLAFSSDGSIETIEPDGTDRTVLTTGCEPTWSADGAKLAFSPECSGFNSKVDEINADGSGRRSIFETCGTSCYVWQPSWSPDGSRLALTLGPTNCGPVECGTSLAVVSASGGALQWQVAGKSYGGHFPAWAPDGSRIAFTRDAAAGSPPCWGSVYCHTVIHTIGVDGSGVVRLTNIPSYDSRPSWSPDGRRIAFAAARDSNSEIYTINADGSGQTQLTHDPAWDVMPAWSPDGSKIAFTSNRDGNSEIHLMNPDGTGVVNLTKTPKVHESSPDWQPLSGSQWRNYRNRAVAKHAPQPAGSSAGLDIGTTFSSLSIRSRQRLGKLSIRAVMPEAGRISASGTVRVTGVSKAFRFRKASAPAQPGVSVRLELKLPRKAARAVRRLLRRHRKVTAAIRVTAADSAGNRKTERRAVRLKP